MQLQGEGREGRACLFVWAGWVESNLAQWLASDRIVGKFLNKVGTTDETDRGRWGGFRGTRRKRGVSGKCRGGGWANYSSYTRNAEWV